jgi:hypothetical protein
VALVRFRSKQERRLQLTESDLKESEEIPTQQISRNGHFAETQVERALDEPWVLHTNAVQPRCNLVSGSRAEDQSVATFELEPNRPADSTIEKGALRTAVEMTLNLELLIPVGMSKGEPQSRER